MQQEHQVIQEQFLWICQTHVYFVRWFFNIYDFQYLN